MYLLPAVDLLDGNAVRLAQGKRDELTIYSKNPVSMAKKWEAAGAAWLHVVDLNGAFDGDYINIGVAREIIQQSSINIELSGGIRSDATLRTAIEAGAARVVLGTKACEDPVFVKRAIETYGPEKIAVAIDAKAGKVVARGWMAGTSITPSELVFEMTKIGVEIIVCTDVSRDGMMQGPNQSLLEEVLEAGPKQVIASGGISGIDDLKRLKTLEPQGVVGAIIGKALYEGAIDLREALKAVA